MCMYISFLWFCVELVELGSGYNLWLALHPLPLLFFFLLSSLYTLILPRCFLCVSLPPSLVLLFFKNAFIKELDMNLCPTKDL